MTLKFRSECFSVKITNTKLQYFAASIRNIKYNFNISNTKYFNKYQTSIPLIEIIELKIQHRPVYNFEAAQTNLVNAAAFAKFMAHRPEDLELG